MVVNIPAEILSERFREDACGAGRVHDDMVLKALSWALRVLVQHDREAVEAFLAEYDDVLAARVVREVRNKLETGLKNPRRK